MGNFTLCLLSSEGCNLVSQIPYRATGKNPYDQRIPCEHGNLCYDFDHIGTYLNTKDVQTELGVNKHWGSCNYAVNMAFQYAGDWMHGNYALKLSFMLATAITSAIGSATRPGPRSWNGMVRMSSTRLPTMIGRLGAKALQSFARRAASISCKYSMLGTWSPWINRRSHLP